jgi:Peptidase family M23
VIKNTECDNPFSRLSALPLILVFALAICCPSACNSGNDSDNDNTPTTPAATTEPVEQEVRTETLFRLPLIDDEGTYSRSYVIGVDHDPENYTSLGSAICTNYEGEMFPYCYDGHDGTDYMLYGSFDTMDLEIAYVYAAADGEVIATEDGNYDRCHVDTENLDAGNISCDGNEIKANYVKIEHQFGLTTLYYHLKSGSIMVEVGDVVTCGDPLALVGSSGISSFPHLHFEINDEQGETVDPYSGPKSQEKSYWVLQDGGNGLPAERCQGRVPRLP